MSLPPSSPPTPTRSSQTLRQQQPILRSFSEAVSETTSTSSSRRVSAIPTPTKSPSPASTPVPKTRARDLLRKHYGLGMGPPPPLSGKGHMDPMDLDSTAFDAKAYYEQLITTSSLPVLLKRENDLMTEIRQLDSERQSLVYNHHHELIAASDTIAAVKNRAEQLDADMDRLRNAFSEISRLSAELAEHHQDSPEGSR
ncbi:Vps51/Vps67-domain-containing protein [Cristinia sonorae]|uniref:Vacuolar protein sorting-associated protein 51 homolog n=1 Tax=Cristinia sonorae TaxID=1940300 RepID=A0A8K0XPW6_9AGAR|nr:Vps51/Vps67-domain-containing protein [Cristinia sonorae]